ncbi:MAG: isoprenylcysteine carboxylmethyltransferase family protein [Ignavibacteria bacterium]|nr:isoprenylcysteine carboxylmethyltransferase family protein [Ignavibacteria bacterium]
MLKKIGTFFFRNRSYTPIPFIVLLFLFINPTSVSLIAGFGILICGEIIRIWAVSYAGSETRTTGCVGGTELITQGPYSVVRNPLYAGNIMIYLGAGIMSMALFPWLQVFAFFYYLFQYYCIIINEEEYLESAFPDTYLLYKKNVHRILPAFRKLPEEIKSKKKFDLKKGFKSEKKTLIAIALIVSLILIFYIFKIKLLAA